MPRDWLGALTGGSASLSLTTPWQEAEPAYSKALSMVLGTQYKLCKRHLLSSALHNPPPTPTAIW